MAAGLSLGSQFTSGLQPVGSSRASASGEAGHKRALTTPLLVRVVSLEGPPRDVVLEGTRVTGLGVAVPALGSWRAVTGQVVNVLHSRSFRAVVVF